MSLPKVKIKMTGPGQGTMELDGVQIPGLSRFNIRCKAREYNTIWFEILAKEIEIEGPFKASGQVVVEPGNEGG